MEQKDTGRLFLPVSEGLQTAVDESAALYGAILSALALAIALRLTTRRSVLKVRRGTHHHGPRTHTHTQGSESTQYTQAFLFTDSFKHAGTLRHKYTLTYGGTEMRTHVSASVQPHRVQT